MAKPQTKIIRPTGSPVKEQPAPPSPLRTSFPLPPPPTPAAPEQDPVWRYAKQTSDELGKVLGVVAGVLDYGVSAGRKETLETSAMEAIAATEYALTLCRNLAFLTDPTPIQMRMTDLAQLLVDSFRLFEKYLAARHIQPSLMVETASFIPIDPNAIHQVISNLLFRASRNLRAGSQLSLALSQNSTETRITYSDDSHPASTQGEDLEMKVARRLVEAHGGTLTADATLGSKNSITIRLPYDSTTPQPAGAMSKRRNRRATVQLPADFQFVGNRALPATVLNLSAGGAYLALPSDLKCDPPAQGSTVRLRIHAFLDHTLEIPNSKVANVRWGANSRGFGVEFPELEPRVRKIIAGLIKGHIY